ncbi:RIP homotypic interaction motif-containing protein [Leptolyngbya sp. PCC 6406]|uniref:RIP homotypic interaction motif-containing protein n=1 Tax=Leptolyngbya sp. PCC 6406 TaxID=1173264 RepID=UPI0002AC5B25|nr:RIP homotypic interaction motif-containing protein [Leptolyngbya sp. PCC 6406]
MVLADLYLEHCEDVIQILGDSGIEETIKTCRFESNNVVEVYSDTLDVEEGSKIQRILPGGKTMLYTVLEVDFRSATKHEGSLLFPAHYILSVRKDSSLKKGRQASTINIKNCHAVQVGDDNIQQIMASFSNLEQQIDSSYAAPQEKQEAKNLLYQFLEHPLVTSILGGVSGGIAGLL